MWRRVAPNRAVPARKPLPGEAARMTVNRNGAAKSLPASARVASTNAVTYSNDASAAQTN